MNPIQLDEESIFDIASQIESPDARRDYLQQVCGGDSALIVRVTALLEINDRNMSFLASPPVNLAATVTGTDLVEKPGDVIGPYKLLQKIGEGGFGVVYMAQQDQPVHRKVALKIIKPGMDSREVIARFEAERQALALMEHPNIARVLDAGQADSGRPYFAMELVRGVPVTDYADRNQLTTRQRLELFTTVCQAVQHAHHKGIIHRDIKPSNVMVTLHDGTPIVKVIDFGVAKALNQKLTEKTLFTSYGQMIGTPQYMSPEQAEMSGLDVDTRSDIYSLGVLLYELLTGTTPLNAEQLRAAGYAEVQKLIQQEDAPPLSTRLSTLGDELTVIAKHRGAEPYRLTQIVRGELDWIVLKSLEKERGRRYETASEFSADVQRYLDGDAVEACPPSMLYRVRKLLWRHRGLASATAAVAIALLLGLAAATAGFVRANAERNKALVAQQDAEAMGREAQYQRNVAETQRQLAEQRLAEARRESSRARTAEEHLRQNVARTIEQLIRAVEVERNGLGDSQFDVDSMVSRIIWSIGPELGNTNTRVLTEQLVQHEDEIEPLFFLAAFYAYTENRESYNATCELMIDRFKGSTDRGELDRLLKSCLLQPFSEDRWTDEQTRILVEMQAALVNVFPRDSKHYQCWVKLNFGLWHYRMGDHEKAIGHLRDCIEDSPFPSPTRTATAHLVMAHNQWLLGRKDEARASLQSASEIMESLFRQYRVQAHDSRRVWDSVPANTLRYLVLCREIEPEILGELKTALAHGPADDSLTEK